jgi:hypothetical protein
MSDVTFVKTRHFYGSYSDVIQLAELSGFDLCYPDEIDAYDASKCYLILTRNGEFPADGWPGATATLWHYNLEWDEYPPLAGMTRTFSADKWFAEKIGADYLPMGSHRDLNADPDATMPHEYDAALLAYLGPYRRGWLVNQLQQHLRLGPNAWNPERDTVLRKSRSMLNIHQREGVNAVAAQRFAVAAAYRLPVITETLNDSGIFDHTTILATDYANFVDFAQMWLCRNDGYMLQEWGERLYQLLCVDNTFEKCVNAAV